MAQKLEFTGEEITQLQGLWEQYTTLNPEALFDEHKINLIQTLTQGRVAAILAEAGDVGVAANNKVVRELQMLRITLQSKIAQIQGDPETGNPVWNEKGGATTERGFNRTNRTLIKELQEIFVSKRDRLKLNKEDVNTDEKFGAAVDALVIDPKRLTNTMLRHLGLEEYIPQERTGPVERLQRRAEAIPALKEMLQSDLEIVLDHQHPMRGTGYNRKRATHSSARTCRLMVIRSGKNEGMLITARYSKTKEGKRKVLSLTDVHGADRRFVRIRKKYEKEIADLVRIETELTAVRDAYANWDTLHDREDQITRHRETLLAIVEELETADNQFKAMVKVRAMSATDLRDELLRLNPSAKARQVNAALTFLQKRMNEIREIKAQLARDTHQISVIKKRGAEVFNRFFTAIRAKDLKGLMTSRLADILRDYSDLAMRNKPLQPYKALGEELSYRLKQAARHFRNAHACELGDDHTEGGKYREMGIKEGVYAYVLAKLELVYDYFQKLSKDLLECDNYHRNYVDFYNELENRHRTTGLVDVAPNIDTEEYDTLATQLYHLFNGLKKELRKVAVDVTPVMDEQDEIDSIDVSPKEVPPTREEIDKMIVKMRRRISNVDVTKILRAIIAQHSAESTTDSPALAAPEPAPAPTPPAGSTPVLAPN
jgi:prefoldin subunit 5